MSATESTMLQLGFEAPHFSLPNTNPKYPGELLSLDDFQQAKALLIMFVCNHCPYVVHLRDALVEMANEYQLKGLQLVAISSNNAQSHPQDGPEKMREEAARYSFPYPYLFDEMQTVAISYKAACTPDFFLFDAERKLQYRGRFDGARPGNKIPVSGKDMRTAVDAVLSSEALPEKQIPSMGCNIKWAPGNEPSYFLS